MRYKALHLLLGTWLALLPAAMQAQPETPPQRPAPVAATSREQLAIPNTPFVGVRGEWALQTLNSLSLEEKIAQLFMVQAFTRASSYNRKAIELLIRKYKIGGLIFMQGGPMNQLHHANLYQRMSDLPLLVGQDAEWGLSMRLDSTLVLPKNMTLGAIENDSLLFRFGQVLAEQCRAVGVHINFAPVVDVNNNSRNPVINDRSFGEDKHRVTRRALMLMQGMQQNGVIACAKHFPGHGDTDTDSHLDMPVIDHSRARLDTLELYPFQQLIREGVMSVMVAHLYVPALDTTKNRPTTLSPVIIRELLQQQMGFGGLVFTDALNMKGLSKFYPPGKAELAALLAGNDVLLYPENVPLAIQVIKQAVFDSVITEAEIDRRVLKILLAKEWAGLNRNRYTSASAAREILNSPKSEALRAELYRASVTLAQNPDTLLPLRNLEQRIAYLQLGYDNPAPFYQALRKYNRVDYYNAPKDMTPDQLRLLLDTLRTYNTVVVGLLQMTRRVELQYGVPGMVQDLLCGISKTPAKLVIGAFGNPYSLQLMPVQASIVVSFDETPEAQQAAAEVVFGGRVPPGVMPVTPPGRKRTPQPYPTGFERFGYARPDSKGLDAATLGRIDSIVYRAIGQKAMPGCAILVMRGDRVVLDRGYGYTDYDRSQPVDPYSTVYDLASVTKVAGTTLAAMKLAERGLLDLEAPLTTYLPELSTTNKAGIRIKHLLQHDAGLPAFKPFWKEVVKSDGSGIDTVWMRRQQEGDFTVQIGPELYLHKDFRARLLNEIYRCELIGEPGEKVVYSDLGMILLAEILERQLGERLEFFLQREFYQPMGMTSTYYLPALKCLPLSPDPGAQTFPPTVQDSYFRFGTVQGFVNDETATLLGGYSGHAGLFSNVYDLGKLMLMLKNGGVYGGRRYLSANTIAQFTKRRGPNNRRGLGWDKPETEPTRPSPTAAGATASAFGHLGFTGTCVWVDPEKDLVFVLLSNRTWPDPNNKLFNDLSIRTKVMQVVYDALENAPNHP